MLKIMVFGTFDIFHEGHRNFLRGAKKSLLVSSPLHKGDKGGFLPRADSPRKKNPPNSPPRRAVGETGLYTKGVTLIVVVARDRTVLEVKGKLPRNSEKKRVAAIKKSGLADKIVLGRIKDKYALIKKYKPDIICLGYDQKYFISGLRKKIKEFGLKTKIKRLSPYKPRIYKSSKLNGSAEWRSR